MNQMDLNEVRFPVESLVRYVGKSLDPCLAKEYTGKVARVIDKLGSARKIKLLDDEKYELVVCVWEDELEGIGPELYHKYCMNELDVGDVVDLRPSKKLSNGMEFKRVVIEALTVMYWDAFDSKLFTLVFRGPSGLPFHWPAFQARLVEKKPSSARLDELRSTIDSECPTIRAAVTGQEDKGDIKNLTKTTMATVGNLTAIGDTRPYIRKGMTVKLLPYPGFDKAHGINEEYWAPRVGKEFIVEQILRYNEIVIEGSLATWLPEHFEVVSQSGAREEEKPYNPDCMRCHGDGFTEETGGKWPCPDCCPEDHKFVNKQKPEPKPKPYHTVNEAGEVEICMMHHGAEAIEAISLDDIKRSRAAIEESICNLYTEIERLMRLGFVGKARIFTMAEQAALKIKREREFGRKLNNMKGEDA